MPREIMMPDEPGWGEVAGELHTNCAVVVCYVCHGFLALVATFGIVGSDEARREVEKRGWAKEPCDLWACPNCKDVPLPEHEVTQ